MPTCIKMSASVGCHQSRGTDVIARNDCKPYLCQSHWSVLTPSKQVLSEQVAATHVMADQDPVAQSALIKQALAKAHDLQATAALLLTFSSHVAKYRCLVPAEGASFVESAAGATVIHIGLVTVFHMGPIARGTPCARRNHRTFFFHSPCGSRRLFIGARRSAQT